MGLTEQLDRVNWSADQSLFSSLFFFLSPSVQARKKIEMQNIRYLEGAVNKTLGSLLSPSL